MVRTEYPCSPSTDQFSSRCIQYCILDEFYPSLIFSLFHYLTSERWLIYFEAGKYYRGMSLFLPLIFVFVNRAVEGFWPPGFRSLLAAYLACPFWPPGLLSFLTAWQQFLSASCPSLSFCLYLAATWPNVLAGPLADRPCWLTGWRVLVGCQAGLSCRPPGEPFLLADCWPNELSCRLSGWPFLSVPRWAVLVGRLAGWMSFLVSCQAGLSCRPPGEAFLSAPWPFFSAAWLGVLVWPPARRSSWPL